MQHAGSYIKLLHSHHVN